MPRSATTFKPGNTAALTHGLRSRTAVEQRTAAVRAELSKLFAAHVAHLTPADQPLVDLAVDLVAKLRLMSEYLDRTSGGSLINLRGKPRPAAELYLKLHRHAVVIFHELGIGPAARAAVLSSLGPGARDSLVYQLARRRAELTREASTPSESANGTSAPQGGPQSGAKLVKASLEASTPPRKGEEAAC
jgi:hypothetical protein